MEGIRARLSVSRASNTDESQLNQMIQEVNPRLGPTDPDVRASIAFFVQQFVDPRNIVPIIMRNNSKALSTFDQQKIRQDVQNHGDMAGAVTLFDRLVQHEGWFVSLTTALRDPEVKLGHVADLIEDAATGVENLGGEDNEGEPSDRLEDHAEQEIENTIPKVVDAVATDGLGSAGERTEQNHQCNECKRPLPGMSLPQTLEEKAHQKEEYKLKEEQHRVTQRKYRDVKDENDILREQVVGYWKEQFELKEEELRDMEWNYQEVKDENELFRADNQKLRVDLDNLQRQVPAMKKINILLVGGFGPEMNEMGNSILSKKAFEFTFPHTGPAIIQGDNGNISVVAIPIDFFFFNVLARVKSMEIAMSLKTKGYDAILCFADCVVIKIFKQIFGETSFTKHTILLMTSTYTPSDKGQTSDLCQIRQEVDQRVLMFENFSKDERDQVLEMIDQLTATNGRYTTGDFLDALETRQELKQRQKLEESRSPWSLFGWFG